MLYDTFDSLLGLLTLSTDGQHITGLHIKGDRYLVKIPSDWTRDSGHDLLQQARQQLNEYFRGDRRRFNLPLWLKGTPFQRTVWQAVQHIPVGTTTSYREIAETIGKPKAVRAVGTAIGRNPICIIVPCHRVLGSNGTLSGYVAGLARKRHLLELERKI